jgi:integrase
MYVNAKTKEAFTLEQLKVAFNQKWESSERKIFALVGAVTGMRISEISAIREETLFKDYIDVKDQMLNNRLKPVKDGERRKVRICNELYKMLSDCVRRNGGYAFTEAQDTYRGAFYKYCGLLEKDKRTELGLSFHSLRHFVNTYLITNGITEIKVKSILGHSSGKGSMTERYLNFLPEHFNDIADLQSKLICLFRSV